METYYSDALKQGKNGFKQAKAKDINPYLPVLDEMIEKHLINRGIDIGYKQIPLSLIVGTKTSSRSNDFACNFMPIQDENSEFAYKWENLCQSHLAEGIREPILVYEYMNRYYVQEGNKRVSVLKYFDGYEIPAHVKRIMPENLEDDDVKLYLAFLDFVKYSKIEYLEFSKRTSYIEFLNCMHKELKEVWNEDERKDFDLVYYKFLKACNNLSVDKLSITIADALLTYIKIFTYEHLRVQTNKEIEICIRKIWKELTLLQEHEQMDMKLDVNEEPIFKFPSFNFKKKKIAFIYEDEIEKSGWRKSHEQGRNKAQSIYQDKIETSTYLVSDYTSQEETLLKAIDDGANIIIATEVNLLNACLKTAIEHQNVKFLNCCLNTPHKYVQTFYPRMYEAKFITGAIAATLSENNKIGYICKYPIYGAIAEINAFARGAALVNPHVKIYVKWTSNNIEQIEQELLDLDIHYISYLENGKTEDEENRRFGLAYIDKNEITPLVLPIWNWGTYYENIFKSILNGSYYSDIEDSNKSVNYFFGISTGVIDIMYSNKIPKSSRYLGETLFKSIKKGITYPFYEMNDESGTFIFENTNDAIQTDVILNMDYLEDNIVGNIPEYDSFDKSVQNVIDLIGVPSARKEAKHL